MTEITNTMSATFRPDEHPAAGRGGDLAGGGRGGHHEHHARLGDGADAGNRPADGRRRPQPSHPPAVPRRGRGVVPGGRRLGILLRPRRLDGWSATSCTGPRKRRSSPSSWPCWSRPAWASSSASIPPGRPRGWTPSRPCATSKGGGRRAERGRKSASPLRGLDSRYDNP